MKIQKIACFYWNLISENAIIRSYDYTHAFSAIVSSAGLLVY